MTETTLNTILAIDCGSATTTAALIELSGGHFRLTATGQAPSSYQPPWQDITIGMLAAARQIELVTGRTFFNANGWPMMRHSPNQSGLDVVIIVASAAPPLPVMLVGLMKNISLTSARRAAATTYTRLTGELALDLERGPQRPEAQLQIIQAGPPEVIILVGGTDNSPPQPVVNLARLVAMAIRALPQTEKPTILYAGNNAARPQIAEMLGPIASLRAVDNVRPTLELENLAAIETELQSLYAQRKMALLPGFQKLGNWSPQPVLPASQSFARVIAYIGQHNHLNVLGVNVGSGATVVSTQTRAYSLTAVRSDAGVGHGLAALLKNTSLEKFQRWLPFALAPTELHNHLLNKCLYPTSLPETEEDRLIEQAVACEAIRLAAEPITGNQATEAKETHWNLIIGAGQTLTRAPQPAQAMLVLLNALEPRGVISVALDAAGVANLLGAIAAVQPVAAVEVGARDAFLNLGTVIAPGGHGRPGKPALKLKITPDNGPPQELEVAYGTLQIIPLPPGQRAKLEIRPGRHFDIGLGQPGRGAITEVEGGILGIVVDARGRPLRLPKDESARQAQLKEWHAQLGIVYANSNPPH